MKKIKKYYNISLEWDADSKKYSVTPEDIEQLMELAKNDGINNGAEELLLAHAKEIFKDIEIWDEKYNHKYGLEERSAYAQIQKKYEK